jgi:carbon-monoxide dehydrogenase medium subunit
VIPATVRYARAGSVEEAVELLAEPEARALAGGQSLIPLLKLRVARPSLLVDVGGLALDEVVEQDDEVRIGALATWDAISRAPALDRPELTAVGDCVRGIGDLQVRNRGTVGGSLAHADPASDMPAVLLALGARLELASPTGARTLDLGELFVGPFLTSLGAQELVTEVVVPVPPAGSGSAYVSVEHPASGFALAGAAALVDGEGARGVAVTGIAATPVSLDTAHLDGSLESVEVFGDRFAPEPYRRRLARVVVDRALELARSRSGGAA